MGRHGLMPGAQFLRATFLNVGRWCSARVLLSAGRLVVLNKMSASKNGQGCRKKTEVGHECLRLKKKITWKTFAHVLWAPVANVFEGCCKY